jgi:hypothetical protein
MNEIGILKKLTICVLLMSMVALVGGSTETIVFTGWTALATLLLRKLWAD